MSRKLDKLVVGAMVLLSTGVFADTHVWKSEGRVNDWDWNEPGNYDSSLGAAGVPEASLRALGVLAKRWVRSSASLAT